MCVSGNMWNTQRDVITFNYLGTCRPLLDKGVPAIEIARNEQAEAHELILHNMGQDTALDFFAETDLNLAVKKYVQREVRKRLTHGNEFSSTTRVFFSGYERPGQSNQHPCNLCSDVSAVSCETVQCLLHSLHMQDYGDRRVLRRHTPGMRRFCSQ